MYSCEKKPGDFTAEIDPFLRYVGIHSHKFLLKKVLLQRQILTAIVYFYVLYSLINSKVSKRCVQQDQKLDILAKFALFSFYLSAFGMKTVLFQCQLLTIGITFQVLSIGQCQKRRKHCAIGSKVKNTVKFYKFPVGNHRHENISGHEIN